MNKKIISLLTTVAIIIIGFLISSVLSNQKESLHRNEVSGSTDDIKTVLIENKIHQTQIETSGRLLALNKIEIYAEVTGVLENESIKFKEGNHFKKGEILIHIDDEVYRNNVLAQKSSLLNQFTTLLPDLKLDYPESYKKWENYLSEFDLEKDLLPLPKIENAQEKYYIASRNIFNLYYSVKSMDATLKKYYIRAPYDGVVTSSNLNPGTLVRSGQLLGEFVNTTIYELDVAVGIKEVNFLKPGMEVYLSSQDIKGEFIGHIARINNSIDQTSQAVKVFIQVSDPKLKDGLYLTAKINTNSESNVAEIPRNALTKSNYVYVLNSDESLNLHEIEIVENKNKTIFVTGLKDGLRILGNAEDNQSFHHTAIN